MVLIVAIFTMLPFSTEDQEHAALEDSIVKIERTVRFSVNEAILRNVIIRLKFDLNKEPISYIVEYGKKADLVLPEAKDLSRLSIRDREAELQVVKKFDGQFSPVDEFLDEKLELPEGIEIYGVGTTYYPSIVSDGEASIYFYPTGEKDSAIILLNNELELGTLSISPFEDKTEKDFYIFTETELQRFDSSLESKAKEKFEQWLKD